MLAPRKTLWSTPDAALPILFDQVKLDCHDVCVDIGCGDGRVLLKWAELVSASNTDSNLPIFLGIDTDEDRIENAVSSFENAVSKGLISPKIKCSFICANALGSPELWKNATVVYLYLTPRGMRLIRPLLQEIRVISYMNTLPDCEPLKIAQVKVPHQPGSAWPLYIYDKI